MTLSDRGPLFFFSHSGTNLRHLLYLMLQRWCAINKERRLSSMLSPSNSSKLLPHLISFLACYTTRCLQDFSARRFCTVTNTVVLLNSLWRVECKAWARSLNLYVLQGWRVLHHIPKCAHVLENVRAVSRKCRWCKIEISSVPLQRVGMRSVFFAERRWRHKGAARDVRVVLEEDF